MGRGGRGGDVWLASMNVSVCGCLHGSDKISSSVMETNGQGWGGGIVDEGRLGIDG